MTDIELRSEHGKIVGYDEDGQRVSIDLESVGAQQHDTVRYASAFDGADGGTKIQHAIDDLPGGGGVVVVGPHGPDDVSSSSGALRGRAEHAWEQTRTIHLPDYVTLLLCDAYVFATDGFGQNSFTYADETGTNTVSVIGLGNSIIDGNAENSPRADSLNDKDRSYICMEFINGNDLTLEGFTIRNPTAWSIKTRDVTDIDCDVEYDCDGSRPNQDGIHVIGFARDVAISSRGTTHDDDIALDARHPDDADGFHTKTSTDHSIKTVQIYEASISRQLKLLPGSDTSNGWINNITVDGTNFTGDTFDTGFVITDQTSSGVPANNMNAVTISNATFDSQLTTGIRLASKCQGVVIENVTADRADLLSIGADITGVVLANAALRGDANSQAMVQSDAGTRATSVALTNMTATAVNATPPSVISVDGTIENLVATNIAVDHAHDVIGGSGTISGFVDGLSVRRANTVYANPSHIQFGLTVPPFDGDPGHRINRVAKASPSWDPDDDGNGEWVVSDGTDWQELVDLPNWT